MAVNWNEAIDDSLQWHDFLNPVGMASFLGNSALKFVNSISDPDYSFNREAEFNSQQAQNSMDFEADQAQKAMDFEADQAQKAMDFEADQAQINRDYQTEMSNTAYQRAVEDMKLAGINPVLAYMQGGASTPSGSSASSSMASGRAASGRAASVSNSTNDTLNFISSMLNISSGYIRSLGSITNRSKLFR